MLSFSSYIISLTVILFHDMILSFIWFPLFFEFHFCFFFTFGLDSPALSLAFSNKRHLPFKKISNSESFSSSPVHTNTLGSAVFEGGPGAPSDIRPVVISNRFITLAWNPPQASKYPLSGYSVFYKQSGSNR